jgi:RNA polymerase sigma-70 factor (ECF subfamily)
MQASKIPYHLWTDLELVNTFQDKHDKEAYSELYNRYFPKVKRYCLKSLEDEQDAQDAAQEVFLRVYEKLSTLQNPQLWVAWLFSLTRNQVRNMHKKSARNRIENVDEFPSVAESLSDKESLKEKERKLRALPKLLNTPEARILRMKYIDGVTIEQLSRDMHLNKSAVKMRLLRARHHIVDMYERGHAHHA